MWTPPNQVDLMDDCIITFDSSVLKATIAVPPIVRLSQHRKYPVYWLRAEEASNSSLRSVLWRADREWA